VPQAILKVDHFSIFGGVHGLIIQQPGVGSHLRPGQLALKQSLATLRDIHILQGPNHSVLGCRERGVQGV
jgi:hypothetical protein